MCRYCWVGREGWWRAARMAQGLASPVMAYLSLSVLISSAPTHSSGLRAVGCWGALAVDLVATVPLVKAGVQWQRPQSSELRSGASCTHKTTFYTGSSTLSCSDMLSWKGTRRTGNVPLKQRIFNLIFFPLEAACFKGILFTFIVFFKFFIEKYKILEI